MNRSLLYPRATTTRRLIGLDGMWRFSFDPESKGVEAGWALDLPSSLSMPLMCMPIIVWMMRIRSG